MWDLQVAVAVACVVGSVVGDSVLMLLEDGVAGVMVDVAGFVVGSEGCAGTALGLVGVGACVVVAGGLLGRLG